MACHNRVRADIYLIWLAFLLMTVSTPVYLCMHDYISFIIYYYKNGRVCLWVLYAGFKTHTALSDTYTAGKITMQLKCSEKKADQALE